MPINSFSKFLNIYFSRVATILYFYSSSHGLTMFHWNTAECGVPLFILTAEPCTAQGQLLLTAAAGAVWFYKTYKARHYSKVAKMKYLAGTNIPVFNILSGFSWSFMYIRQCSHYQQWMTTKDCSWTAHEIVAVFAAKRFTISSVTLIASSNLFFMFT